MPSHFYAYMARMKFIKRWGLRRNTREENDQEHSLQVAMIAHALCMLRNARYGGQVDPGKAVILAVYHEAAEVITGDLASPIKYFNPGIRQAYKDIERLAGEKLPASGPAGGLPAPVISRAGQPGVAHREGSGQDIGVFEVSGRAWLRKRRICKGGKGHFVGNPGQSTARGAGFYGGVCTKFRPHIGRPELSAEK